MNRTLLQSVLRRVTPLADGDADLLRRFAAERDETAFAALVRRHGPLVWAVCRHLLPNEADAEDAFQATFLALVRSAGAVRAPSALGAWLHGVAYRVAMKAKRTAGRRRQRERSAAAGEAAAPIAEAAWDQLQQALHEEIRRLPEPLRTAFVLCELQGAGQREAAAALGWKRGTLSGRLTKSRHQLLTQLAKRGLPAGAAVGGVVAGSSAAISAAPAALVARAMALPRLAPDLVGVSQTVLELARGAMEVPMTRTKLFTAAVVLTGILAAGASTVLPLATAQRPLAPVNSLAEEKGAVPGVPRPAQSSAADSRHPAQYDNVAAPAAKGQWEYKFIPRKSDSLEAFERLLNDYAAAGWEYCDTVSLIVTDPRRKEEWGTNPTIVFKRPVKGYRAAMSGMMGQQNEMLGLNNSMRPTPTGEPLIMPGQPGDASSAKPMKPGSEKGTPAIGANDIFVIRLAHAEAVSLAKTLVDLFKNSGCRIVAETRTNALLVQGDAETVKAVASVVEKVDTPAPPKSGPK